MRPCLTHGAYTCRWARPQKSKRNQAFTDKQGQFMVKKPKVRLEREEWEVFFLELNPVEETVNTTSPGLGKPLAANTAKRSDMSGRKIKCLEIINGSAQGAAAFVLDGFCTTSSSV